MLVAETPQSGPMLVAGDINPVIGSEHTRSHPLSTRRNLGLLPCVTNCRSLRIRRVTFVARQAGPRRLNILTKLAALPEPPWGIEPQTYALRGCSRALLAGSRPAFPSGSASAAGGDGWLLMAVRGHLGDTPWPPRPAKGTCPDLPFFRPSGSTGEPAAVQRGAVPSTVGARRWLLSLLSRLITSDDKAGPVSALSRLARIRAACR
jgi:hypothetical protein